MKNIKWVLLGFLLSLHADIYAQGDPGILQWTTVKNIRTWNIHSDDIPKILKEATDYLMGFAATISIIFIIIGAYKIMLWRLEWDVSDGRKTIFLALAWFVLASISWLILKLVIDNFS